MQFSKENQKKLDRDFIYNGDLNKIKLGTPEMDDLYALCEHLRTTNKMNRFPNDQLTFTLYVLNHYNQILNVKSIATRPEIREVIEEDIIKLLSNVDPNNLFSEFNISTKFTNKFVYNLTQIIRNKNLILGKRCFSVQINRIVQKNKSKRIGSELLSHLRKFRELLQSAYINSENELLLAFDTKNKKDVAYYSLELEYYNGMISLTQQIKDFNIITKIKNFEKKYEVEYGFKLNKYAKFVNNNKLNL